RPEGLERGRDPAGHAGERLRAGEAALIRRGRSRGVAFVGVLAAAWAASASAAELTLVRGVANPEDVQLAPAFGVLLVSEMGFEAPMSGGGLSAVAWSQDGGLSGSPYRLWPSAQSGAPSQDMGDPACSGPPDPSAFSGHGLSTRRVGARRIVASAGHGARE